MNCGKGLVQTQDLEYQAECHDHCATRPVKFRQNLDKNQNTFGIDTFFKKLDKFRRRKIDKFRRIQSTSKFRQI